MSSPAFRIDLVQRGLQAWEGGEIETVLELIDPEAEVESPINLVNPGVHRGRQGFLEWTRRWMEAWEEFESEIISIEPFGEHHALATLHQRGRGRGSGVEVEMDAIFVFEEGGGRAVRIKLFDDRAAAEAAARAGEEARDASGP